MKIKCPSCEKTLEISNISRFYNVICKNCEARFRGLEAPVDYVSYRVRGLIPFVFSKEFYVGESYPDSPLDDNLVHSTICYYCGKRVNIIAYVDEYGKQYFTAYPKCPYCLEKLPQENVFRNNYKYQVSKDGFSGTYTAKELLKLVKSKQLSDSDLIWKAGWPKWKKIKNVKMYYIGAYTFLFDTPDVFWEDDVFEFSLDDLEEAKEKYSELRLVSNYTKSNYFNEFGDCKY